MAEIILVDDNPVVLGVAGDVLTSAGHSVRTADSGTQMMQELLLKTADVIVLDVNMPGMSGDRLARILSKSLDTPLPRIVLFSGMEAPQLRRLARSVGATGWVKKGSPKEALLQAVEAAICLGQDANPLETDPDQPPSSLGRVPAPSSYAPKNPKLKD